MQKLKKDVNKHYLKIGKILSPIGLKGECKIYVTTSFIKERFKINNVIYIELDKENILEVKIKSFIYKKNNIYQLSLYDINSIDEINKYLNLELLSIKDNSLLKEDEFYNVDLIDSLVYDENDNLIGKITSIKDLTYINSIEITLNNKKKIYIPFNDFYFLDIDLKNKKIILNVIAGLLEI